MDKQVCEAVDELRAIDETGARERFEIRCKSGAADVATDLITWI